MSDLGLPTGGNNELFTPPWYAALQSSPCVHTRGLPT